MFQIRGLGEDWSTMPADSPPAGEDRVAAATYCGKKFGATSPYFQPCVDFYAGPHIGEYVPSSASPGTVVKAPNTSAILSRFGISTSNVAVTSTAPITSSVSASVFNTLAPAGVPWYKTPLGIGAIVLGGLVAWRKLRS